MPQTTVTDEVCTKVFFGYITRENGSVTASMMYDAKDKDKACTLLMPWDVRVKQANF